MVFLGLWLASKTQSPSQGLSQGICLQNKFHIFSERCFMYNAVEMCLAQRTMCFRASKPPSQDRQKASDGTIGFFPRCIISGPSLWGTVERGGVRKSLLWEWALGRRVVRGGSEKGGSLWSGCCRKGGQSSDEGLTHLQGGWGEL